MAKQPPAASKSADSAPARPVSTPAKAQGDHPQDVNNAEAQLREALEAIAELRDAQAMPTPNALAALSAPLALKTRDSDVVAGCVAILRLAAASGDHSLGLRAVRGAGLLAASLLPA